MLPFVPPSHTPTRTPPPRHPSPSLLPPPPPASRGIRNLRDLLSSSSSSVVIHPQRVCAWRANQKTTVHNTASPQLRSCNARAKYTVPAAAPRATAFDPPCVAVSSQENRSWIFKGHKRTQKTTPHRPAAATSACVEACCARKAYIHPVFAGNAKYPVICCYPHSHQNFLTST